MSLHAFTEGQREFLARVLDNAADSLWSIDAVNNTVWDCMTGHDEADLIDWLNENEAEKVDVSSVTPSDILEKLAEELRK